MKIEEYWILEPSTRKNPPMIPNQLIHNPQGSPEAANESHLKTGQGK
jgi:hypothetical protein